MTQAPHVVVRVTLERDGKTQSGWASEHLPPKWFTKDPESQFHDDIVDMVAVIEHAVEVAKELSGATPFELWWSLQNHQAAWARSAGIPGLLSGLGTALIERAIIDASCRMLGVPFVEALAAGHLGFDASRIHPELPDAGLSGFASPSAAASIAVRHTVGLSDPITEEDVTDFPDDKLPVSLDAIIRRYGVTHFKVKTAGHLEADIARLHKVFALIDSHGIDPWFTIDGNESMHSANHLVTWGRGLFAEPGLGDVLRRRLIAVEQPFHRSMAMDTDAALALGQVEFPVIIDESDDGEQTVREAMDLGYAGGTYKGCKGVFRGLANAALIAHRGRTQRTVLTAEDLSTLPPLTVAQDLVVAAVMGLEHIERNGHHYFGRLAPLDPRIEDLVAGAHPDAYERNGDGRSRLRISHGSISLGSILAAPFGFSPELDISALSPLSASAAIAGLK
jgi:hypothetical protein